MIYRAEVPIQRWGRQQRSRKKLDSFGPCHLRGLLEDLQKSHWVGRQDGDPEVVSSSGPDSPATEDRERGPRTEKHSHSEVGGDRRVFRREEKVANRGRTAGQQGKWEPRKRSGVEAEVSGLGGRSLRCAAGLVQWMRGKKVGVPSMDTSLKKIVGEDIRGHSSWRKGEVSPHSDL